MDKTAKIKSSIRHIVSLSEEEFDEIDVLLTLKTLYKDEFFLEEGKVCDFIGFVHKGSLIYFKTLDNGNEITTDFAFEGDWVTNNLSRLNHLPSLLNIKAIEETELLILQQAALDGLYNKIPKFERLGRILTEQAYVKMVQQNIDLQVLNARDRYENLLRKHPEIFQKVPQYHIANYLGIAPKSLSRIRKEILGR